VGARERESLRKQIECSHEIMYFSFSDRAPPNKENQNRKRFAFRIEDARGIAHYIRYQEKYQPTLQYFTTHNDETREFKKRKREETTTTTTTKTTVKSLDIKPEIPHIIALTQQKEEIERLKLQVTNLKTTNVGLVTANTKLAAEKESIAKPFKEYRDKAAEKSRMLLEYLSDTTDNDN
jgi:hypothetical protein